MTNYAKDCGCGSSRCNNGWITYNGSEYPCGTGYTGFIPAPTTTTDTKDTKMKNSTRDLALTRALELSAEAFDAEARAQQLLADYRAFGEDDDLHLGMAQAQKARRTRREIDRLLELADS